MGAPAGFVAFLAITAVVFGACAEAAPSVAPTVRPTPVVTPDPHLPDPTSADEVYRGLGAAGIRITANNATAGAGDSSLVKRINATYLGWPLNISQYRSSSALVDATDWDPDERPGQGEAPVAIAGANILVTWGPMTGEEPATPDARQVDGLQELVAVLDRLLSPIRARTAVKVSVPGAASGPATGSTASPDATTADREATPTP